MFKGGGGWGGGVAMLISFQVSIFSSFFLSVIEFLPFSLSKFLSQCQRVLAIFPYGFGTMTATTLKSGCNCFDLECCLDLYCL